MRGRRRSLVMMLSLLVASVSDAAAQISPVRPSGEAAARERAWHSTPPSALSRADIPVAQESHSTYWLTAGAGLGSRGGAGVVGGAYQFGRNLLTARGAGTVAFFGDGLWDIGLLYGRASLPGLVHLSLAAGVAAVGGTRREESLFDPSERMSTTIGLPFEVQLFFRLPVLGVGVYGFGNINDQESFGGIAAAVQIGRVH
jgi:hypothetical protein